MELLGTAPCNRSGLGVSGFHVHEVVASLKTDGLSRRRYRDATVVKVPAAQLDAFREFNKRMCENDDLLPAFAPDMRYVLLTKPVCACAQVVGFGHAHAPRDPRAH